MKGEHFLEVCCGTGVFSIFAALDAAEKVVAIDINPDAVENTIENSKKHEVSEKVTVLQGFMFSPLQKEQLFDVIFLNIPFLYRSCSEHLRMQGKKLSTSNVNCYAVILKKENHTLSDLAEYCFAIRPLMARLKKCINGLKNMDGKSLF